MEITNFQGLFEQGRLTDITQFNTTDAYLTVGIHTLGVPRDGTQYPIWAIRVSDLISASAIWGGITGTLSNQVDLQNALNLKANLASPTFTGTPLAPTAAPLTNNTQIATTAYVDSAVGSFVAGNITEVQYNDGTGLGAASTFTYDSGADILTAGLSNFDAAGGIFDSTNRLIKFSPTVTAIDFSTFLLYDTQVIQQISLDFSSRLLKDAAGATTIDYSQTFLQLHGSNIDADVFGTMGNDLRIGGDANGTVGKGLYLKAFNDIGGWRTGLKYLNTAGAGNEPSLLLVPDSFGNVGINIAAPLAKLHTFGVDSTGVNQRVEPVTGVIEDVVGATVNTVDATTTTLQTISIPNNTVVMIETRITCRKTAGVGVGTIGDGNGYIRVATYANIAGVVTLSGSVHTTVTGEGISSFDTTLTISGTNVLVEVTGAVNDDVTWNTITRINRVT